MTAPTSKIEPPRLGEPYLLTPGPLTTSYAVKEAMLRDWGSWDDDFRGMTRKMRGQLLEMLGEGSEDFDCVPMQGSGSFSVEAMLASFIPRDGKALVLANGAYGMRSAQTLEYLGREHVVLNKGDYLPPRGDEVAQILADDPAIRNVVLMCPAVNEIDFSALETLEAINERLRDLGIGFHLSEVKGPVMDRLATAHLLGNLNGDVYLAQYDAWCALAPVAARASAAQ